MHQISVSKSVIAPAKKAWEVLDDFGNVYHYNPYVKSSEIINGQKTGPGAERVCHFHDGNTIKERINEYQEGKLYSVEIFEPGSFPLKRGIAKITVTPVNDTLSNVNFTMTFEPRFGPLGWVMAHLMMKPKFKSILGNVISGLDAHIQTGEVIDEKSLRNYTNRNAQPAALNS